MTMEEMVELFEKHEDEYIEFERIENPLHPRPDICAFLLLHNLVPEDRDIISWSEHDEYGFSIRPEELAEVVTEEDIITLRRCGLMYNEHWDCFSMYS